MDRMPAAFDRTVPVPGLIDLAQPPFAEVGTPKSNAHRRAFWYRRTFRIDGNVPAVAKLKIHKACYGTAVYLNGRFAGEHLPCFTPFTLDVGRQLQGDGRLNELVVRVGAYRDAVPRSIPDGWDVEKSRYIPGIYDSVELILSGAPHIVRVQAVPEISGKTVRVVVTLGGGVRPVATPVTCLVREAVGGKLVGSAKTPSRDSGRGGEAGRAARTHRTMPAVVAGGPVPLPPGGRHVRRHALDAVRHEDVLVRSGDQAADAQRAAVLPARHERLHLPVLRRRGPWRPAVAAASGCSVCTRCFAA